MSAVGPVPWPPHRRGSTPSSPYLEMLHAHEARNFRRILRALSVFEARVRDVVGRRGRADEPQPIAIGRFPYLHSSAKLPRSTEGALLARPAPGTSHAMPPPPHAAWFESVPSLLFPPHGHVRPLGEASGHGAHDSTAASRDALAARAAAREPHGTPRHAGRATSAAPPEESPRSAARAPYLARGDGLADSASCRGEKAIANQMAQFE